MCMTTFLKEEEEREIVNSGDSRIKRVLDRLATLSIYTNSLSRGPGV